MKIARTLVLMILMATTFYYNIDVSKQATAGVSVGDRAKYSVTAGWNSENPNASASAYWRELENTRWETVTVQAISGTNITILVTTFLVDDTQMDSVYWGDIATNQGRDEFGFQIVPARLYQEDRVRQSSISINYTTVKEYAGQSREVNYAALTIRAEGITTYEYYWDKETGFLCASLLTDSYLEEGYMTRTLLQKKMVETNMWQPQNSSSQPWLQWTAPVIVTVIVVGTLLSIKRSRSAKKSRRRR